MDASEYLAFIPLLIYGISLSELLGQWKRLLERSEFYLPYFITTLILTETGIYNVFIYLKVVGDLPNNNYFTYLSYLATPVLFMLTTNAFTPEKGVNTKEYFNDKKKIVFTLFAVFALSHFLYSFSEPTMVVTLRIISVVVILLIGWTERMVIFYIFSSFWLLHLFFKGTTAVGL